MGPGEPQPPAMESVNYLAPGPRRHAGYANAPMDVAGSWTTSQRGMVNLVPPGWDSAFNAAPSLYFPPPPSLPLASAQHGLHTMLPHPSHGLRAADRRAQETTSVGVPASSQPFASTAHLMPVRPGALANTPSASLHPATATASGLASGSAAQPHQSQAPQNMELPAATPQGQLHSLHSLQPWPGHVSHHPANAYGQQNLSQLPAPPPLRTSTSSRRPGASLATPHLRPHRVVHYSTPASNAAHRTSDSPGLPSPVSGTRRQNLRGARRYTAARYTMSDPVPDDMRSLALPGMGDHETARRSYHGPPSAPQWDEESMRRLQFARGAISSKLVASKAALQSLRSVNVADLPANEKMCVICYNDYGVQSPEGINEAPLRLPGCGHVFGDHCIKKWLEESDNCPYCRDKLPSEPKASPESTRAFLSIMRLHGYAMPSAERDDILSRLFEAETASINSSEATTATSREPDRRSPPSDHSSLDRRRTRQRRTSPEHDGRAPPSRTSSGPVSGPAHNPFATTAAGQALLAGVPLDVWLQTQSEARRLMRPMDRTDEATQGAELARDMIAQTALLREYLDRNDRDLATDQASQGGSGSGPRMVRGAGEELNNPLRTPPEYDRHLLLGRQLRGSGSSGTAHSNPARRVPRPSTDAR